MNIAPERIAPFASLVQSVSVFQSVIWVLSLLAQCSIALSQYGISQSSIKLIFIWILCFGTILNSASFYGCNCECCRCCISFYCRFQVIEHFRFLFILQENGENIIEKCWCRGWRAAAASYRYRSNNRETMVKKKKWFSIESSPFRSQLADKQLNSKNNKC